GIWADQIGGRRVFTAVMLCAAAATWLLTFMNSYNAYLVAALLIGLAGGSFSVGIPYVSKWFRKEKQGTALGIFGAGNIGAAVTKLLAPMIMVAMGWKAVAEFWAIGLAVTAVLFFLLTREDPEQARRSAGELQRQTFMQQLKPL